MANAAILPTNVTMIFRKIRQMTGSTGAQYQVVVERYGWKPCGCGVARIANRRDLDVPNRQAVAGIAGAEYLAVVNGCHRPPGCGVMTGFAK